MENKIKLCVNYSLNIEVQGSGSSWGTSGVVRYILPSNDLKIYGL